MATMRAMFMRCVFAGVLLAGVWPAATAHAELVLKLLVVNPSDTETKSFDIRNPLPPEVKPEHVLDTDGLKVDYDAREGVYMLVGTVTLKPKETLTKQVVIEDVWMVPAERFSSTRRETGEIESKLSGTPYAERGAMLIRAIERRLGEVEDSQDQPFMNPMQHITRYRENLKTLDMVETDMVSLRQLMVMAALNPSQEPAPLVVADSGAGKADAGEGHEMGGLSILATWRLIFIVIGLLGFVSISFFLVWQRQLKVQLAKQNALDEPSAAGNGAGAKASDALLDLPPLPGSPAAKPPKS